MRNISKKNLIIDLITFINTSEFDEDKFGYYSLDDLKKFRYFDEANYFESITKINHGLCDEDIQILEGMRFFNDSDQIVLDEVNEFPLTKDEVSTIKNVMTNLKNYQYRFEDISPEDFDANFHRYIKLYNSNKSSIPVTHFFFYTTLIEHKTKVLYDEFKTSVIDSYEIVEKDMLGFEKIFKSKLSKEIEDKLYKATKEKRFFTRGLVDEDGLYLNPNDNLISLIQKTSKDKAFEKTLLELNKDSLENEFKTCHSYFAFNWLNNTFIGSEVLEANLSEETRKAIYENTQKYQALNKWSEEIGLINYLERTFTNSQIKIIISLIAQRDFSNLSIRNYTFDALTELFTFCYLIGYFDFLSQVKNQDLNSINGFNILDRHLNFFDNQIDIKVFRDYYKQKDSPTNKKRYPFNKREKVKKIITQRLGFSADKLQKIPNLTF